MCRWDGWCVCGGGGGGGGVCNKKLIHPLLYTGCPFLGCPLLKVSLKWILL